MEILKKYERWCKKSVKINTGLKNDINIETAHMHQDMIYRAFINDICSEKLKYADDIRNVAKIIKRDVVKFDRESNRWYA